MGSSQDIQLQEAKSKLLFVDDERSILDSLRRVCRSAKYQVFVAEGGKAGLDIMAEHSIDLVISDMRMPEMTGAEFLEQVANQYPETVRILLTGYSDIESTITAINKGKIYSYIAKPWDNDQLKMLIEKALYTKKLEDEHRQLLDLTRKQNQQLQDLNESLEGKVAQRTQQLQSTVADLDKAHAQLKGAYASSVEVFSRLIELREGKTANCGNQVAEHVRAIAQKMNLAPASGEQLYYAALLRNIGKMGLTDDAITQPFEKLGSSDKVAYKKHPALGEALLLSVEALQEAATYIRHHRERADGKGFPDGLLKEEIPLGARILSVASDYDDMINGMISEIKLTSEKAQAYIASQVDKRYDKTVVDVYLTILKELDIASSRQNELELSATELKEGMVLARDIITPEGLLLLSGKQQLDNRLIKKIQQFQEDASEQFAICVKEE